MKKLLVGSSPHIRAPQSTATIMWTVALALLPAGMFSIYVFGLDAVHVMALSVGSAVATEFIIARAFGKKTTVMDGSAVITGLLLAYILPPTVPWYVPIVGAVFAIGVVKMAFGGLGLNIWNPALAGRAFLLSAYAIAMTAAWIYPPQEQVIGQVWRGGTEIVDTTTAATPRDAVKQEMLSAQDPYWPGWEEIRQEGDTPRDWAHAIHQRNKTSHIDLLVGTIGGSIGETSALLLLLGGLYLMLRRIIAWQTPVFFIATVAVLGWALPFNFPDGAAWFAGDPLFEVLSGGLILGAFFMATDYTTSPVTRKGMAVFAVGCGVITVLIRRYGGFPEGVNYAILLMNTVTPLIDRYVRPRKYGASR